MARRAKAAATQGKGSNAAKFHEQQASETRRKLMAAIRRIESGAVIVGRLSTAALADEAGVDRTTLYRGYDDMLDAWEAAKARMRAADEARQPAAQVERLRRELFDARAEIQRISRELEVASQQLNFVVQDRDWLSGQVASLKRRLEGQKSVRADDGKIFDITSRRP